IRTFSWEAKRYGPASTMSESVWDHPFQWGSKRNGPDLAREGGKYPSLWLYRHMLDPREVSPGSIMPPYPVLATAKLDASNTPSKMRALRSIGVPYEAKDIDEAQVNEAKQAAEIVDELHKDGANADPQSELVA